MFSKAFSSFSVDDLASAKDFYGGTLGLDVSQDEMGLGIRLPGGGEVFVYPKAGHVPATFTVLNFRVDKLDAAMDALDAKGVRFERYDDDNIRTDARGVFTYEGMKVAWFKDPAGNVVSVIQEC